MITFKLHLTIIKLLKYTVKEFYFKQERWVWPFYKNATIHDEQLTLLAGQWNRSYNYKNCKNEL